MLSSATEAGAKTTLEALSLGAIDFIPKTRCKSLLHEKLIAAASVRARARRDGSPRNRSKMGRLRRLRYPKGLLQKPSSLEAVRAAPRLSPSFSQISRIPLPVPVFVAQHMPRPFTAALARRLQVQSGHSVVEARDGDAIANGVVYIAPGGLQTRASESVLSVRGMQEKASINRASTF